MRDYVQKYFLALFRHEDSNLSCGVLWCVGVGLKVVDLVAPQKNTKL